MIIRTHGRQDAATIVAHSVWFFGVTLLTANHAHVGVAKPIVPVCAIGVFGTLILTRVFALPGAAAC